MTEFINRNSEMIGFYNEKLVMRLIEKVTSYDNRFEVKFELAISLDIE